MLEIQTILQNILQTANVVSDYWQMKKNDINGGPKWKPIRGWPYQNFKFCEIVCDCSITHLI